MTGFLGSGKTTLINQLIATKPIDERWALLINEFGRIGIDGALLASSQGSDTASDIAIREVSGGCICCTSQLPLQIALSRLLSDHHPKRLLIEPTGLAHPRELIKQLSEPHWQRALKMQAVIAVLNALQWQTDKYRTHEGFQAHVRDADVIFINRYARLNNDEKQALQAWIAKLNKHIFIIWADPDDQTATNNTSTSTDYLKVLNAQLSKPSFIISNQQKVNITQPYKVKKARAGVGLKPLSKNISLENSNGIDADSDIELPYRYHEQQQDIVLAGWQLPKEYVLNTDKLQDWLLKLSNWQRIKGIVHTSDGWLQINFTPDSLTTTTVSTQVDSRLEIILQTSNKQKDVIDSEIDWEAYDHELMAMVMVK